MKKLNFIFVSLQRIHGERDSTSTNLAKELAKSHQVLYVNAPVDRRTYYFRKRDKVLDAHIRLIKCRSDENLLNTQDNLWVLNPIKIIESLNWIPSTRIFRWLNKRNNSIFSSEIRGAITKLGFDDFILINDKDIFRSFHLKELLKPSLHVYLDRDYIVGMDYWKKHGPKLEPELMKKSDIILCNSVGFTEKAKQINPKSYYIGNGCNIEIFDAQKKFDRPVDLAVVPGRPIIGYIGALVSIRLDIELLIYMASHRPGWDFVFIGQEDEEFIKSELHAAANVRFLGKRDTTLAPAYIQHFDVCINPQLVNAITTDNYPLKIDEYLAMGRPVVATETNLMKQVFSSVVRLARTPEEYLNEIEQALKHKNDSEESVKRIDLAKQHSWETIAGKLLGIVKRRLNEVEGHATSLK